MAISTASQTTTSVAAPAMIASTTWPARTGVATASTAITIDSSTKAISLPLCGRAKLNTRLSVSFENGFEPLEARVML